MKTYKQFKEVKPEITVNNIRGILTKMNILLLDSIAENDGIYACRVILGNHEFNKLEIGTNGKGSSFEYSLASGYAEFMEKLQNRYLYDELRTSYAIKKNVDALSSNSEFKNKLYAENLILDFKYDEREEYWTLEQVLNHFGSELMLLFHTISIPELKIFLLDILRVDENSILMIPCYSQKNNNEEFIPIDLIMYAVGSNGMTAGNSQDEALLHGFCEIFERYALQQIYYNKLTPPTIPLEDFIDTPIYDKIKCLQRNKGYEIIIKDCSLGKGLPVIGVIIIDTRNHLYNFKLGSSFVQHIAIDRCLNEVYQSNKGFIGLDIEFILPKDHIQEVFSGTLMSNYHKILETGSGIWPLSILFSSPSYLYSGANPNFGLANDKDLNYCIDIVSNLGFNIFIRNNSITDFPTYYICIPGMSQVLYSKEDYENKYAKNILDFTKTYPDLSNITLDEARRLAKAIESRVDNGFSFDLSRDYFVFSDDEDILRLDTNIFLGMLNYFIGDYHKSRKFISRYIKSKPIKSKANYLKAMLDYIDIAHINQLPKEETKIILERIYGVCMANEVINNMLNPLNIFQHYIFPDYFNCDKSELEKASNIFSLLKIEKKLNDLACKNKISYKQILNL